VIGKEISTPGTADVTVIRLIVVVLVTVTEALYPRVDAIELRGRPVPLAAEIKTVTQRAGRAAVIIICGVIDPW